MGDYPDPDSLSESWGDGWKDEPKWDWQEYVPPPVYEPWLDGEDVKTLRRSADNEEDGG
jgi:hypothetical protein